MSGLPPPDPGEAQEYSRDPGKRGGVAAAAGNEGEARAMRILPSSKGRGGAGGRQGGSGSASARLSRVDLDPELDPDYCRHPTGSSMVVLAAGGDGRKALRGCGDGEAANDGEAHDEGGGVETSFRDRMSGPEGSRERVEVPKSREGTRGQGVGGSWGSAGHLGVLLREAKAAEARLGEMMKGGGFSRAECDVGAALRAARSGYKALLLADLPGSLAHGMEQRLWALDHHVARSHGAAQKSMDARGSAGASEARRFVRERVKLVLRDAAAFYTGLLSELAEQHYVELDASVPSSSPWSAEDNAGLADLPHGESREAKSWASARSIYLRAVRNMPWSGRAHNSLAVLASYENNHLELVVVVMVVVVMAVMAESGGGVQAAYRYVRALTSAKGFQARENLLALFERNLRHLRDARRTPPTPCKDPMVYVYFLRFHGVLYTRVGLENMESLASSCLQELRLLLESPTEAERAKLDDTTLVVMAAASIFSVHQQSVMGPCITPAEGAPPPALPMVPPADPETWPESLVAAISFAMEFLDSLVRSARRELEEHGMSTGEQGGKLGRYLAPICVMLGWMQSCGGYLSTEEEETSEVKGFLPEYYTNHEYVGGMRAATKLGLADNPARIPDNIALIQPGRRAAKGDGRNAAVDKCRMEARGRLSE
eukprot:gene3949-4917_t